MIQTPGFPVETRMKKVWGGMEFTYCPEHPYTHADGYLPTGRLVLEKKLGRLLKPEEKVRHIDADVGNDNPENLSLEIET